MLPLSALHIKRTFAYTVRAEAIVNGASLGLAKVWYVHWVAQMFGCSQRVLAWDQPWKCCEYWFASGQADEFRITESTSHEVLLGTRWADAQQKTQRSVLLFSVSTTTSGLTDKLKSFQNTWPQSYLENIKGLDVSVVKTLASSPEDHGLYS